MFNQLVRRRVGALSVLAILAVLGPLLLSGFGSHSLGHSKTKATTAAAAPPEITVAQVLHRPLREWQEFSGRLQAVDTVEIRPRVSGYIDRVAFEDGARVKKGQLLFQIDPRPFQAEVNRLVAERSRSVSDLELAQANRARAERLIGAHAISREEYERLVAAVSSAQGALGSIDASLQEARLNREFTEVRAPIDGHVSRAIVTAGNLVTSTSLLTTLVSDDPVYVYFDADEQTYLRYAKAERDSARPGAAPGAAAPSVYVGLIDEQGYPHRGALDFIDNHVDPASGTIRARAALANPDGRYTPGLFARVRLVGGEDRDSVLIEDRAVGTDLSKKFVLTLTADNRVEYRLVDLGPEIDGLRVVEHGLKPGDVIVVNGMQHVRPGQVAAPTLVSMSEDGAGLSQVAGRSRPPRTQAQARLASAATH
ncbi:MAG TPA: efflux RND transporter periplasmic adaptor subunit [Steroidobacteraceae bacterium]|nr:efflux RND transporter periplasmic adaptor subunit [Steroidobacteraceae bacterium]